MVSPDCQPSKPEADSDAALMGRVRHGDEGALDTLIQRHATPLLHYATGFERHSDAEDIVQEAFVRLWEGRSNWKDTGKVRVYLYKIVRNLCLNARARRAVRNEWVEREQFRTRTSPSPWDILQEREVLEALEKAIQSLPERRREVFSLVCLHGLSHDDVADAMGVARRTVYNQFNSAINELRQALRSVSNHRI